MAKKVKRPLSFIRRIVTGHGRTTGYDHAFKMDKSKANPNLDLTPDAPKQPITTLPKGGKKTFLVSGAKDFNFTEGHEKQLVRNFRNFEKKYGSAQIAHDYNPSNKTSAFVARVAKKYNLPLSDVIHRMIGSFADSGDAKDTGDKLLK